ncbi:MAG: 50S ribosomal protein L21 [Candidatus Omnitrophota bacterium]
MYAIVAVGNKQYKITENDQIVIERTTAPRTHKLSLDKVLVMVKDKKITVGTPYIKDAKVECEVLAQVKGEKKIAYRYRRRKSSQSKKGHRQKCLLLKVKNIKVG